VSAKAHPRAVGVFVLGAIALVLGAIVLLSSGHWFEPRHRFAVFFPGSVRGLNPGAPVAFRGVKVGEVKDVTAFVTGRTDTPVQIEVVIEVRTRVVESPQGMARPLEGLSSQELAKALIDLGVRARMLSQSLLTGQRYIDMDFLPQAPARFAGLARRYPELPTTPTSMDKLSDQAEVVVEKLATLPLDQMLEDVRKALQSLREVLSSPELKGTIAGANRVTRSLDPAVQDAHRAIAEARVLIGNLDGRVTGLGGNTETAIKEMRDVFAQTRQSLDSLDRTLSGADDTRLRATETLGELEQAMKAIRHLVEYIQTHPEAMVQGKSKEKQ
jgi:paraquat-inducible protein B